jgi:hypothetical protein
MPLTEPSLLSRATRPCWFAEIGFWLQSPGVRRSRSNLSTLLLAIFLLSNSLTPGPPCRTERDKGEAPRMQLFLPTLDIMMPHHITS